MTDKKEKQTIIIRWKHWLETELGSDKGYDDSAKWTITENEAELFIEIFEDWLAKQEQEKEVPIVRIDGVLYGPVK